MRFPAKKNAGCPKAPRDFPLKKDGILHFPSGCLATPLPLPQGLYGRTDGRTLTSPPKFLGSLDYQISLAIQTFLGSNDFYNSFRDGFPSGQTVDDSDHFTVGLFTCLTNTCLNRKRCRFAGQCDPVDSL